MIDTPGDPLFTATRFDYAKNGRTVTYVLGEEWEENRLGNLYRTVTYAREFRYDSALARYLSRELDPFQAGNGRIVQLSSTWSYYEGDTIYGVACSAMWFVPCFVWSLRAFDRYLIAREGAAR